MLQSILTVVTPAPELSLLTTEELRYAIGLSETDATSDNLIDSLGEWVTSAITAACNVQRANTGEPATLLLETLSQKFRFFGSGESVNELVLARRPIVAINSITVDDTVLTSEDYFFDGPTGIVHRLWSGYSGGWLGYGSWSLGTIVVNYTAGYSVVPADLKLAAIQFAKMLWAKTKTSSDPLARRIEVPGVSVKEFWVGPVGNTAISRDILDILDRGGYVNITVS